MKKGRMPKSLRRYIRLEKSRIRRDILGVQEQENQIQQLYQKLLKAPQEKENLPLPKSRPAKVNKRNKIATKAE